MSGPNSKKLNKKYRYDNSKPENPQNTGDGFKIIVSKGEPDSEAIKVGDWWAQEVTRVFNQ
jgi:hypothetical protein